MGEASYYTGGAMVWKQDPLDFLACGYTEIQVAFHEYFYVIAYPYIAVSIYIKDMDGNEGFYSDLFNAAENPAPFVFSIPLSVFDDDSVDLSRVVEFSLAIEHADDEAYTVVRDVLLA